MWYIAHMGLIEKIFGKRNTTDGAARGEGTRWRTFTEWGPVFTSYDGKVYQQELTRAAIERFATACSKLKPERTGDAVEHVTRLVGGFPNDTMTWPAFLKRVAAIYDADGTVVIVPTYARDMETVTGLWPLRFETAEVVEWHGAPWIRFTYATGTTSAIELDRVCILNKFQIESDVFGEPNCLDSTLQLIHAQDEAQRNAISSGAKIRFIGALNGMVREEDMKKKRERFMEDNFRVDNNGGLLVYDNTFNDVRQVEPQSYVISDEEMARIASNVCNYFGISEDVLQNKYSEDVYGAWYESKVEPFAVALGEGITRMFFTPIQVRHGNRFSLSSNRLEYASNASKRNMIRDMLDRGVMSINEAREILQMGPVPDGDVRVIRGEYVNAAAVSGFVGVSGGGRLPMNTYEKDFDLGGDDDIYNDSDAYGAIDVDE